MLAWALALAATLGALVGDATGQQPSDSPPDWARLDIPDRDLPRIPRRALVIGVGEYKNAPRLAAPAYDAVKVRDFLVANGFTAQPDVGAGASLDEIRTAISTLRDAIAPGDIVVVFFSGHGLRRDTANYLVASDGILADRTDEPAAYISLHWVMRELVRNNPLSVAIILDACRRDPFAAAAATVAPDGYEPEYAAGASGEANAGGLGAILSHSYSSVSFAFSAGVDQLAYSYLRGERRNQASHFTRALVEHWEDSEGFEHGFKQTSRAVSANTGGAQVPTLLSTGAPEFMIARTPSNLLLQRVRWTAAATEAARRGAASEQAEIEELNSFLGAYPASDYASVARARIAQLEDVNGDRSFAAHDEAQAHVEPMSEPFEEARLGGALRSRYIDAANARDIAVTTGESRLVRPQWGGMAPDQVVGALPEGQEVRVIRYQPRRNLAQVELPDGSTGYIRGVTGSPRTPLDAAELVYEGSEIDAALTNAGELQRIHAALARQPGAALRIAVGAPGDAYPARAQQVAHWRALQLRRVLRERGIDVDRALVDIADPEITEDHARIEVLAP